MFDILNECEYYNLHFDLIAHLSLLSPAFDLDRIHLLELLVGSYILSCALYDLRYGHHYFYIFLFLQSTAFFIMGFGFVGNYIPS
jgi:hypothetical protein